MISRIRRISIVVFILFILLGPAFVAAQENTLEQDENSLAETEPTTDSPELKEPSFPQPIFDDKLLLNGYTEKYSEESKEILLEMIKDDTLPPYRMTAAVRAFKKTYCLEVFSKEKRIIEKIK